MREMQGATRAVLCGMYAETVAVFFDPLKIHAFPIKICHWPPEDFRE
jgi:hypothetical protein